MALDEIYIQAVSKQNLGTKDICLTLSVLYAIVLVALPEVCKFSHFFSLSPPAHPQERVLPKKDRECTAEKRETPRKKIKREKEGPKQAYLLTLYYKSEPSMSMEGILQLSAVPAASGGNPSAWIFRSRGNEPYGQCFQRSIDSGTDIC